MRGWVPEHIKEAKEITKKLRIARRLFDFTQNRVAAECGHSQSWLSDVESGKQELTLTDACQLAEIYGFELRLCEKGKA